MVGIFLVVTVQATPEQLEVTRIYKMLAAKYEGKTKNDMSASEIDGFQLLSKS